MNEARPHGLGILSPKQARFVQEYLIDSCATQAAIRAEYSKKTAGSQGQRLLTNVDIAAAIAEARAALSERTEITAERICEKLWNIAIDPDEPGRTKVSALVALGRKVGMFVDKLEHSGKIDGGVLAVPMPVALTDWNAMAAVQQAALKKHAASE